jgi:CheY-like chemotaxis protein
MISSNNDPEPVARSQEIANGEQRRRALIVEDNRDSRDMMRTLLTSALDRLDVTAVETAAEALALDAKSPFDIYVLDIWLPGMDGLDLCRRLRERGRTQPIMFFSAMVQPNDRHFVLAAGANEFLVKPKDIDLFLPTVEKLLGIAPNGSAA